MNFLANENLPFSSIDFIRKEGHLVISIAEISPGIFDKEVLDKASKENLIILTFDRDYGELIFKYNLNNPPSVVYFRYKGTDPSFVGKLICNLIRNENLLLKNRFTVIEENDVRQRNYY
jgi:predicted nuclease of predicted toxin-antitoxin system